MSEATSSPRTADERENIVRKQDETVTRNVNRTARQFLRRILRDLAAGKGRVSYIPPDASTKHGCFAVQTPKGRALVRITHSQIASLRKAGVGLTESTISLSSEFPLTKASVPLASETLERFRALLCQTQAIMPEIDLKRFNYAAGAKADKLRAFVQKHQGQNHGPADQWLRLILEQGAEEFLSLPQWELSPASRNIFVEICISLEAHAQPQTVIDAVLQKLEEAVLALQAAAAWSPAWSLAKIAENDAFVKKLNEEQKPTGQDLIVLRQTYEDAWRRSAEVQAPVIEQFAKALRLFYGARALAAQS